MFIIISMYNRLVYNNIPITRFHDFIINYHIELLHSPILNPLIFYVFAISSVLKLRLDQVTLHQFRHSHFKTLQFIVICVKVPKVVAMETILRLILLQRCEWQISDCCRLAHYKRLQVSAVSLWCKLKITKMTPLMSSGFGGYRLWTCLWKASAWLRQDLMLLHTVFFRLRRTEITSYLNKEVPWIIPRWLPRLLVVMQSQ